MSLGGTRDSNSKWRTKTEQKQILVNRLIFVSYHLTSLDLFTRKLQFCMQCFVTTRPSAVRMNDQKNLGTTRHSSSKWRMKTEQIQVLLNMLNLLFSNTLLPLTSLPVTCKHVPLHATSLYLLFPDTIVPLTSSPVTCNFLCNFLRRRDRQQCAWMTKRIWVQHATHLQSEEWKQNKSRSFLICLIYCFLTP